MPKYSEQKQVTLLTFASNARQIRDALLSENKFEDWEHNGLEGINLEVTLFLGNDIRLTIKGKLEG